MNTESIILDFDMKDATSILCQAMFDETLRLRKCWSRKEKDSIRKFLIESYQLLFENMNFCVPPEVNNVDFKEEMG